MGFTPAFLVRHQHSPRRDCCCVQGSKVVVNQSPVAIGCGHFGGFGPTSPLVTVRVLYSPSLQGCPGAGRESRETRRDTLSPSISDLGHPNHTLYGDEGGKGKRRFGISPEISSCRKCEVDTAGMDR